jgi:hypothetical protein
LVFVKGPVGFCHDKNLKYSVWRNFRSGSE